MYNYNEIYELNKNNSFRWKMNNNFFKEIRKQYIWQKTDDSLMETSDGFFAYSYTHAYRNICLIK